MHAFQVLKVFNTCLVVGVGSLIGLSALAALLVRRPAALVAHAFQLLGALSAWQLSSPESGPGEIAFLGIWTVVLWWGARTFKQTLGDVLPDNRSGNGADGARQSLP